MSKINEVFLDEFLNNILTFEKFDAIFKDKLPKDLTKYIYDYVEPFCVECAKCCKLCLYYCNLECLRVIGDRDICCRWELDEEINKYEKGNVEVIDEDIEEL